MFNNAKFLPVGDAVQPNAVVLADALTDAVLAALSHNATVVLVSGAGSEKTLIPTAPNKFDSCWWLGSPADSNVGTVVYQVLPRPKLFPGHGFGGKGAETVSPVLLTPGVRNPSRRTTEASWTVSMTAAGATVRGSGWSTAR